MRLTRWVNASSVKIFLDNGSGVNIFENSDLSLELVMFDFKHFPSEHNIDATLLALFEGNFVGIGESVDLLVGCPVLNASVVSGTAMKLVLSHEMLVVESVEISSFALIGELG